MITSNDRKAVRAAAREIDQDQRSLFEAEVDRSGPHKGKVTDRFIWQEILNKRELVKRLRNLARRMR